jgi:hypothetical protein
MPTMRGFIAVLAGALLLAMTAGCGEERSGEPADGGGNGASDERVPDRAGSAGDRMALDCPTNLRGSGTWEDWTIEGEASPAAVARRFVYEPAGESFTVTKNRYGAQAWILRADETARAVLNVSYKADYGGWYLTTYETCADMPLFVGTGTLPRHEHSYILDPPSGQTPAITEAEAIEAAHRFGLSKYAQLRAAAVRSVYASGYGETFDHHDLWVLAFDVMVPKWGYAHPPGFNKPNNPPVPGTAVVFVHPQTGKVPRALSW